MTILYSTPSCQQCNATKRYLEDHHVDYHVVDLSTDENSMNYVKSLGYSAAPVVVTEDDHWSGFRPDKLSALAA